LWRTGSVVVVRSRGGVRWELAKSNLSKEEKLAGTVFVTWLAIWAILAAVTSAWAFRGIYAATLKMWPNGYLS
jgi:hypothetical protein